jgi:hypothetical protein
LHAGKRPEGYDDRWRWHTTAAKSDTVERYVLRRFYFDESNVIKAKVIPVTGRGGPYVVRR